MAGIDALRSGSVLRRRRRSPQGLSLTLLLTLLPSVWAADGVPGGRAELAQATALAAAYLTRMTGPDGRFVYRHHRNPTVELRPRYNLLRHAGALWSLAGYVAVHPSDRKARAAVRRAAAFLQRCCIAPHRSLPAPALALWSEPEITRHDAPRRAKLGGAGLGLAALAAADALEPGTVAPATLQGLAEFILHLQKPDGSFYSRFQPSGGGRDDSWSSLYYPGEAALGLIALYERDGRQRWLAAAAAALAHLARSRRDASEVPADHWALIATARLLRHRHHPRVRRLRPLLWRHARQVTAAILTEQQLDLVEPALRGGFSADGRTAPTATRLEALLAVRGCPSPEDDLQRRRLDGAIAAGVRFLLDAQLRNGRYAGAMPRSKLGAGPRAGELRIDYTQHALSVFLGLRAGAAAGCGRRPLR